MASWLDPRQRESRLMKKVDLHAIPHLVHRVEEHVVAKMRWEGCAFIRTVGTNLRMFKPALSSACVYFTRFYARNGFFDTKPTAWDDGEWHQWRQAQLPARFRDLHWRFVAIACLFIAGKVEDNPKKIYDVVIQFHKEVPKKEKLVDPELSDGHIRQLKETLFAYERLVLADLDYDMIVEAPIAFNQVAQHIKFMRMNLVAAARSQEKYTPALDEQTSLDADGLQMLRLALDFVENSLLTTLWLEYDAPTIAFGIAWLTAKFFDFAPSLEGGWWRLMNERFEEQNKREDPHTGNIFRLKAPSKEVLDDIGLQLMHYHAEAFPRGKPLFPPNPDVTTGRADGVIEGEDLTDIVDPSAEPYFWRVYCLTADPDRDGKTSRLFQDQGDSVLIKDKDVLRCTCVVWRDLAASGVPEHKRTCR